MITSLTRRIDWKALHARLLASERAIVSRSEPTAERRQEVLAERARRHAGEAPQPFDARERLDVVQFRLSHEAYAIACAFVTEVVALGEYATLPGAPLFVLGVTSVHGRMVSIVDLGRLFDLPSAELTDRNRVLVLNGEGMELGLLADAVDSVARIFVDELSAPLPTLTGVRSRLCRGLLPGGRVLLHARNLIAEDAFSNGTPN